MKNIREFMYLVKLIAALAVLVYRIFIFSIRLSYRCCLPFSVIAVGMVQSVEGNEVGRW